MSEQKLKNTSDTEDEPTVEPNIIGDKKIINTRKDFNFDLEKNVEEKLAPKDINKLSFNFVERSTFLCATNKGIFLYNVDPLLLLCKLDHNLVGSISIAETFKRCQFISLVGGGETPKFAENTVLTWNDKYKEFKDQWTLSTQVVAIRMRSDKLFVAEKNCIHVFCFPKECKKLYTVETGINKEGILEVTPLYTSEKQVIISLGHRSGQIYIYDMNSIKPDTYSMPLKINAHQSEIACIALNLNGTLVATASKKGTLIRIFDTLRQTKILEIRRGVDPATLYCMNFSLDSDFLCASSDKGTIHIFAVKDTNLNKRSKFSNMCIPNTYVNSQWAFTNFTVAAECACICCFGPKNTVYAICVDGTYHKYSFSLDGTCVREKYEEYLGLKKYDVYENFLNTR